MPKFTEANFETWRKPASDHEETKLESARKLVKQALNNNKELSKINYEVFGQGSYANDTNVRLNSDIDLNVMYQDEVFYSLPKGKTDAHYNIQHSNILSFENYKNIIEQALVNEFGQFYVKRENKCIRVLGTEKRVECDVVPTFEYHRYEDNRIVKGIKLLTDNENEAVEGYPKQHIVNAIEKNRATGRKYKRVTRIFKRIRYKMKEDMIEFPDSITSFLIESLMWNVPYKIYNEALTWSAIIRDSIIFLYNNTKKIETCSNWGEVSELLYLFHSERKWKVEDVNEYLAILWEYLELK